MQPRNDIEKMKEFSVFSGNCVAKLDQNESPLALSEKVCKEFSVLGATLPYNRYVTMADVTSLKEELAQYIGVSEEMIAIGAGADSFIHTLVEMWAVGRGKVLTLYPSYPAYSIFSTVNGVEVVQSHLNKNDFSLNKDDFTAKIGTVSLAFITYPNNPTGNLFDKEFLLKAIEDNPDVMFVIDEAYAEFAHDSFVSYIEKFTNITVIRTFSKYFSVPSLRLGYCIARPEQRILIERCQFVPYNISLFSLKAGSVLLAEKAYFQQQKEYIEHERTRILEAVRSTTACTVFESTTNFIFMHNPNTFIAEKLAEKGVFVRNFSTMKDLSGFFRVTIGSHEENSAFITALEDACRYD